MSTFTLGGSFSSLSFHSSFIWRQMPPLNQVIQLTIGQFRANEAIINPSNSECHYNRSSKSCNLFWIANQAFGIISLNPTPRVFFVANTEAEDRILNGPVVSPNVPIK